MNAPAVHAAGAADVSGKPTSPTTIPAAHDTDRRRARSVSAELAVWLTASVERRRAWAHAAHVARETAQWRRQTLLAHPDLAAALAALYRLSDPEHWRGYLPPPHDACGRPNRSREREKLLELLAEAKRRSGAP